MRRQSLVETLRSEINPDVNVLQFTLDGVNNELFQKLLKEGKLPNIDEHIYSRTIAKAKRGLSVFPTITNYGHESLMTGRLSHHPGLRWFDRKKQKIVDYTKPYRWNPEYEMCKDMITLHELITPSKTILEFANKGANKKIRTKNMLYPLFKNLLSNLSYHSKKNLFSKEYVKKNFKTSLFKALDKTVADRTAKEYLKKAPKLCTSWFLGPDSMAHIHGLDSPLVEQVYTNIDKGIGNIADALKTKGIYDKTLLVLFSDHGMRNVKENLDLEDIISQESVNVKKRSWKIRDDVVCTYSGNGTGFIYINDHKWTKKSDKDKIIDTLIEHETTDFVCEGDGEVLYLYNEKGTSMFMKKDDKFKIVGSNILGYKKSVFKKLEKWHDLKEHMEITQYSERPFILASLEHVFTDKRSPDIMVIAKEGYDYGGAVAHNMYDWFKKKFVAENYNASHGFATKECMSIPLVIGGDHKYLDTDEVYIRDSASIIDVMPTVLDLLGVSDEYLDILDLDGIPMRKRK